MVKYPQLLLSIVPLDFNILWQEKHGRVIFPLREIRLEFKKLPGSLLYKIGETSPYQDRATNGPNDCLISFVHVPKAANGSIFSSRSDSTPKATTIVYIPLNSVNVQTRAPTFNTPVQASRSEVKEWLKLIKRRFFLTLSVSG